MPMPNKQPKITPKMVPKIILKRLAHKALKNLPLTSKYISALKVLDGEGKKIGLTAPVVVIKYQTKTSAITVIAL